MDDKTKKKLVKNAGGKTTGKKETIKTADEIVESINRTIIVENDGRCLLTD